MGNKQFTWIPFYEEFANKLLEYKGKRKELVEIVYSLEGKYVNYIHNDDGSNATDIDPFSVFAIFNRGVTDENRKTILSHFKNKLGITTDLPHDYDGVPILNAQQSIFFGRDTASSQIPDLWNLFESAINGNQPVFEKFFDNLQHTKGIKWNLTIGLYWIRPDEYMPLDGNSRTYLQKKGIHVFDEKEITANNYLNLLKNVKDGFSNNKFDEKTMAELSYSAWKLNKNIQDNQSNTLAMQNDITDKLVSLLLSNHNLILTGAPGTGKTYLAKEIAKGMGCSDDEIGFVQFHPSYDYTDFVEGLRPKQDEANGSEIGFERRNGVFKDFCTRALIKQSEESIKLENNSTSMSLLNSNPTVWKVSLKGTGDNPIRRDCLDNGYIRIGWHEYGNVEDFNEFDGYTQYGGKNVLKAFQNQMKEGDIIASCYSENEVDAIGIVTGGYEYDEKFGEYPRYRKVHWLVKNIRENIFAINDNKKFTLSTVYRSNITAGDALKIVAKHNPLKSTHIEYTSSNITKSNPSWNDADIDDMIEKFKEDVKKSGEEGVTIKYLNSLGHFTAIMENGLLKAKIPNGKKHSTSPSKIKKYVKTKDYDKSHDTYDPSIGQYIIDRYMKGDDEAKTTDENENLIISDNSKSKPFVFIIDEINRGEISKIFGELFFSIDPGYRGEKGRVQTQYQNMVEGGDAFKKGFYVPENVYIIGTMNDIDRSVESMDFAFRRRFAFAEIKADENVGMLDDLEWKDEAIERMKRLNEAISKTEGLSSAYHIGASYFMKLKNYNGDFKQLWEYHLEGLLHEYLRGMQDVEDSMKKLKNAYENANPSNGQQQ